MKKKLENRKKFDSLEYFLFIIIILISNLRHCKKYAPAIGQNRSRDFGLSVTNRHDRLRAANNHNLWPNLQKIQTTAYINQNDFY